MVLSRGQRQQVYMKITHLLLYSIAVLLRQCCSLCTVDTVSLVDTFLKNVPKMEFNDYALYTPAPNDYEQNCSKSTMNCFAEEISVLINETQYTVPKQNLTRMLENLTFQLQDKLNPCPQCEVYSEENAENFLNKLLEYLRKMNSSCK